MNVAKKIGNATVLLVLRKMWGGVVTFFVTAYLARILPKEDFGLLAISSVLITFVELLLMSGIGEYVIFYNKPDKKPLANSAFWLILFLSIFVCLLVFILLPFWSSYYNDARIKNIGYLLLVNFFFSMIASIPNGLLRKELDFKPIVFIQTIVGTLTNVSQVVFAIFGYGVYSLALPKAIFAPLLAFLLFYKSNFTPSINFNIKYWKDIFDYTKYVVGQRILGKFVNEGDTLLIGKFFGMASLGIYNISFQFSNLINAYFLPVVTNISLPLLAKYNNDNEKLKNSYYRMIRLISYIFLPMITLFAIFSKYIVLMLYGEKWIDAVIYIKILLVYVAFNIVSSPSSSIFNAVGKPKIGFRFNLISTPIFIIGILASTYLCNSLLITVATITIIRFFSSIFLVNLSMKVIDESFVFLKNIFHLFFLAQITIIINIFLDLNLLGTFFFAFLFLIMIFCLCRIKKNDTQEVINEIKSMFKKK
ncbi:lipopolysaccharide biosynthesis protein [Flavobacterium sp. PLA-1-15]|uniref:lipopolysaccharide biosynthesis protein n=1 Tax=Flavobacterium sp. PLA-1-15 TaxID=3380533 RepID=UPI003B7F99E2